MEIILSEAEVSDIIGKYMAQHIPNLKYEVVRAVFVAKVLTETKFEETVKYFKAKYSPVEGIVFHIKELREMSRDFTPDQLASFPVIRGCAPESDGFSLAYAKYFMDAIRDGNF